MSDSRRLNLLGVAFRVSSSAPELLRFFDAFCGAFENTTHEMPRDETCEITVETGPIDLVPQGPAVPVHRSKTMPYWSFDAVAAGRKGAWRLYSWPARGLEIAIEEGGRRVLVRVDQGVDVLRAGESLYHVCRSIALYMRDRSRGNLVHASAIRCGPGAAVFCGASGAGKTTAFLEMILRHGASPLSNDRVLLTTDRLPEAWSWPGYASFCEGTLLQHPALVEAVDRYERGDYRFRTLSWPDPLRPIFTKQPGTKRMFPMSWLTETIGRSYARKAPLAAVVFLRISSGIERPSLIERDLESAAERSRIESSLQELDLDGRDNSFLPWHGIVPRSQPPEVSRLVARLQAARVKVLDLALPVHDLTAFAELGAMLGSMRRSASGDAWEGV